MDKMTIKEATIELLKHGWFNFYDEEKTKKLLKLNKGDKHD